nr:MAG TPA: hypothetical protein [Caudoviricetes sp.]
MSLGFTIRRITLARFGISVVSLLLMRLSLIMMSICAGIMIKLGKYVLVAKQNC